MDNHQLFNRLTLLVNDLQQKAAQLDTSNANAKNQRQFEHKTIFSDKLFSTRSSNYQDYVNEVQSKLSQLVALIEYNHNDFAQELLTQIEQQISSLLTAIQSNKTRRKKLVANKRRLASTANSYTKAAQQVLMPTHALYAKLAEHHEFERRLSVMIAEREFKRAEAKNKEAEVLSNEILALHQRLGRCRKAITGIEREIEIAEKRSSRTN